MPATKDQREITSTTAVCAITAATIRTANASYDIACWNPATFRQGIVCRLPIVHAHLDVIPRNRKLENPKNERSVCDKF